MISSRPDEADTYKTSLNTSMVSTPEMLDVEEFHTQTCTFRDELDNGLKDTETERFLQLNAGYYSLTFYGHFLDKSDEDLSPYCTKGSKDPLWKMKIRKKFRKKRDKSMFTKVLFIFFIQILTLFAIV